MITEMRPATLRDAPQIAQILSDWIVEAPWMPRIHSPEENRGFGRFLVEKTQVTIAETGRMIDGFIAMQDHEIAALYLRPDARNRGLGGRFIQDAQNSHNLLTLWAFQANTRARSFYAAHGFIEVEMTEGTDNDEKLPDVRMQWKRKNG